MAERAIAGCKPIVTVLEPGTYYWCACGLSKTQPWCDGSHEGTGFEPVDFVVEAAKKCAMCTCKGTHKPPICDGSHKVLAPEGPWKWPASAESPVSPSSPPTPPAQP